MLPKDNNNQSGPSLIWAIKTAFNNYQIMIDKYEQLLLEISALNTIVTEKLEEVNTKLEKIPDSYTLINLDGKISTISDKLTKMILVVTIVGGIGITTYIWINHNIDARIATAMEKITEKIITRTQHEQSKSDEKLYIIDANGNRIPILIDQNNVENKKNSQQK
jgi:hypothetical protein